MASSRLIAAGESYTPDDINNLRSDVLDATGGHDHGGVDGRKIAFSSLDVSGASGSVAPAGGSSSYNDIDDHVQSGQGQHGMDASVYIVGSNVGGTLIQAGSDVLDGSAKTVTFPLAYSSNPIVVATYAEERTDVGNPSEATDIYVDSVSTSEAVIKTSDSGQWGNKAFNWIAVGIRA